MKELKFKLTVGAAAEIAEFCPEKDLAKIGDVMQTYPDTVKNGARLIRALNRGYVMSEDPFQKKGLKVVSEAELLGMEPEAFIDLLNEAMEAFGADKETTVDVEPTKKEKAPEKETR